MDVKRNMRSIHMCSLCNAHFSSARDQIEHCAMPFHKFMMVTKKTQQSYIRDAKTLNEQITEAGKKEPLIGLEYIYEYAEDSNGVRMYECKLCESAFRADAIFFHIVGIQHRVLYLAKHHPIMGIEANYEVQQQTHYRKLANNALAIEQTHGRKKINVVNNVYVSKADVYEVRDLESVPEAEPVKPKKKMSRAKERRKERRALERMKLLEDSKSKERTNDDKDRHDYYDDDDARSWHRDQEPDYTERPGFSRNDKYDDFDARALHRASSSIFQQDSRDNAKSPGLDGDRDAQSRYRDVGSVYQSNNRDIPKFQPNTQDANTRMAWQYNPGGGTEMLPDTKVSSSAQSSINSVPPYKNERPFQPAVEAFPPVGTTPHTAWQYSPGGGTEMLPDAKVRSLAQSGIGSVPPYLQERPFQPAVEAFPPVGTTPQLVAGRAPIPSQDDFEDKDFRQIKLDPPRPPVLHDRGHDRKDDYGDGRSTSRKSSSTSASDSRDKRDSSRRRHRSPDRRSRSPRHRSRFDESCDDLDMRSVLPSGGISFRELRAAHIASLQEGFSSAHLPLCEKKKPEKETDSDMEVCSMEFSDCETDDFWCNAEVLDFLKTYHIADDEGVQFVLQAVKMMSEALVRHNTRKEDLKKRILEEKQRLEAEKQKFLLIKKRKEEKIIGTTTRELAPENFKLFQQVTSTQKALLPGKPKSKETATQPQQGTTSTQITPVSGTAPVGQSAASKPQAETVAQQGISSQKPLVSYPLPLGQSAAPRPQETVTQQGTSSQKPLVSYPLPLGQSAAPRPKETVTQQGTSSQKPLVSYPAPVGQSAAPRPQAPKVTQPPQVSINQSALMSGIGALLHQLFLKPPGAGTVSQPPQGTSSQKTPVSSLGPSVQQAVQKPQDTDLRPKPNPGSHFDKGQVDGTRAVLGSGSETLLNKNPQMSGSRFDNTYPSKKPTPSLGQGAGRYSVSDTRINQNQGIPPSGFDNPLKDPRTVIGQGASKYTADSDSRFPQNVPFSGSRIDSSGSLDKTKPAIGSGSDTRFNQTPQIPGSKFNNPDPSKEPRPVGGQGAGIYLADSDSRFTQNVQFPGSRFDNSGSLDQTKPAIGAGSETRYNQNQQLPSSKLDNPNPSKEPRPMTGQVAGSYSDLEARYNQMQWTSGSQSGSQGLYNTAQPPTGMGAARYGEQYTTNQWQSQHNSSGAFGSGMDRSLGPQSQKPADSTGFSSGTWLSQEPTKYGTYPAGILTNRARNVP